ncbi:MAG: DUF805 domain-containing protein [Bacteroidales bacterium]|nr:DUF805 domain-containing protein [Candidatus Latescibacterota bacterium]
MYEGRWNRVRYFSAIFVMNFISYVIASIAGATIGQDAVLTLQVILWLVSIAVASIFVVKRMHDLDRPGVHYWLLYIPLYNLYVALVLLFVKGTAGPNKYGEDPLDKQLVSKSKNEKENIKKKARTNPACVECGRLNNENAMTCDNCGHSLIING